MGLLHDLVGLSESFGTEHMPVLIEEFLNEAISVFAPSSDLTLFFGEGLVLHGIVL